MFEVYAVIRLFDTSTTLLITLAYLITFISSLFCKRLRKGIHENIGTKSEKKRENLIKYEEG